MGRQRMRWVDGVDGKWLGRGDVRVGDCGLGRKGRVDDVEVI